MIVFQSGMDCAVAAAMGVGQTRPAVAVVVAVVELPMDLVADKHFAVDIDCTVETFLCSCELVNR